jgi:hypothetical protein
MKSYTKSEIDCILALFQAFDITIAVESNPIFPLTIYTNVYHWHDGTYHSSAEPEDAIVDA